MMTSAAIWKVLHFFSLPVDIRDVCVLLAPLFSGFTALATYHFAKEVGKRSDGTGGEAAGLWGALFIGIVPGQFAPQVSILYLLDLRPGPYRLHLSLSRWILRQ